MALPCYGSSALVYFVQALPPRAIAVPIGGADVAWRDGKFVANGVTYQPIAYHGEDAEQVAELAIADSQ